MAAIAQAGEIDALVIALKTCDQDRQRVQRELAALDGMDRLSTFDVKRIEGDLVNRLAEWRGLLKRTDADRPAGTLEAAGRQDRVDASEG